MKRKPTPVTLNIKAEGYSISVDVECDTEDGSTVMLTENKTAIRKIDMGTVSHLNQFYCDVPFEFKINEHSDIVFQKPHTLTALITYIRIDILNGILWPHMYVHIHTYLKV